MIDDNVTYKIVFSADYTIVDDNGEEGVPQMMDLSTPALTDKYWSADNTISIKYDPEDKSATIKLSDINYEAAGTTYADDILDRGYFVTMTTKIVNGKPQLVFHKAKSKPEGSRLSNAEFKKQMAYFDNNLKSQIEEYFDTIIQKIEKYFDALHHSIEEWD